MNVAKLPDRPGSGPLDSAPWPEKLTARVVTPGPRPTIDGYDVEDDSARHYSFAETVLVALTGQCPSAGQGRAFEVALTFFAPGPVNEAPTHAALLARICAGTTSAIQGTAAIALAEQARVIVAEHGAFIEGLPGRQPASEPLAVGPGTEDERESVARLRTALRGTLDVPALADDVGRIPAILATLHSCGLRTPAQIECALVLAKLPVVLAEVLAHAEMSYRDYPVLLPQIAYEESA